MGENMCKLDFIIVGSGLFGAVFAQQCKEKGKSCLVIDKREHIAGNVYSSNIENIDVHMYGPHIFNTNNEYVWNYANKFSKFIQYSHKVKVNYNNKIYSMPINLQTLYEVYGVTNPKEAIDKINQIKINYNNPKNLEEYCLSQVGSEIYEKFIKFYTKKQWGKHPNQLPINIIKRLPIRMNFDDRWHQTQYSGIPINGYTEWVKNILDGINVELGKDFFSKNWKKYCKRIVYTGKIDELFNYCYGELEYRTLKFENEILEGDFQGIAQINYTDEVNQFTRIIEHKHFNYKENKKTVITKEYPIIWNKNSIPYYPINDIKNNEIYNKYKKLINKNFIVGGRLGKYIYNNMDQIIASALKTFKNNN